jgi:ATP-dependent Clp protease ATP-binding subunit ClpC
MRRAIQNLIEDPLAEAVLHGRFKPGDVIMIERQGEDLIMEPKKVLVETA